MKKYQGINRSAEVVFRLVAEISKYISKPAKPDVLMRNKHRSMERNTMFIQLPAIKTSWCCVQKRRWLRAALASEEAVQGRQYSVLPTSVCKGRLGVSPWLSLC